MQHISKRNNIKAIILNRVQFVVAVPESESNRVLATLQSIDPRWHRILKAGGLVLLLPANQ